MKLVFIRHGDPDYEIDSLTPDGRIEAQLLAEYLADKRMDEIFVSPLGRAQATASYTLEKLHRTAETMPWLREFNGRVRVWEDPELQAAMPSEYVTNPHTPLIPWDILPAYLAARPNYFHPENWRDTEVCKHGDMVEVYESVTAAFDELLKKHGYARDGKIYRAEENNDKVLVFFCHFGVTCVLLSHLLGISPFVLWHGFVSLPTGITVVNTEERVKGVACFRCERFGDLTHLALGGKAPSFAARFCERFEDDTMH